MAYECDKITKKDVVSQDEEQHTNRPESPRTTAARYLLDLANLGAKDVQNTQQQIHLAVNTSWGHDKGQAYIEECGLPFTSDQMLVSCHTLSDLNNFLSHYNLTEEQTALCHAAYQMGKGNGCYSSSPTDDVISRWNHHLIHVLDHSYASTNILQIETNAICSSINEEMCSNSDGTASSSGSNVMECDSSLSR